MAPGVFDGNVFVSTVPGNAKSFYKGNGQGVLLGARCRNGEKNWTFDDSSRRPLGSGAYRDQLGRRPLAPTGDRSNGKMFIAIANPAPWPGTKQYPWAKSRPGPNPDTNTLVSDRP